MARLNGRRSSLSKGTFRSPCLLFMPRPGTSSGNSYSGPERYARVESGRGFRSRSRTCPERNTDNRDRQAASPGPWALIPSWVSFRGYSGKKGSGGFEAPRSCDLLRVGSDVLGEVLLRGSNDGRGDDPRGVLGLGLARMVRAQVRAKHLGIDAQLERECLGCGRLDCGHDVPFDWVSIDQHTHTTASSSPRQYVLSRTISACGYAYMHSLSHIHAPQPRRTSPNPDIRTDMGESTPRAGWALWRRDVSWYGQGERSELASHRVSVRIACHVCG